MEWDSGNIRIRPNAGLRAGQVCHGHTHNFDHTTIVFKGSVHVKAIDKNDVVRLEQDFFAPAHFLVKAEWTHEITAIVDGTTYWCVFAHRDAQGEIVQKNEGWAKSYV